MRGRHSIRDRSLSPRRPATILRRRDEHLRESDRSDRDIYSPRDRRLRDYDVVRRSRSPRRIERRDPIVRTIRLSDFDLLKDERDVVGVGNVRSRRVYDDDEDLIHAGSSSTRSQRDQLSDRPKRIVVDTVNDYSYKSDYYVAGECYTGRNGGERDSRVGYADELLPMSRSKQVLPEYKNEGKNLGDPYTWADNVSVGGTSKYSSAGQFSSAAPRYLTSDTERQGYTHFQDELQLDKRDGTFIDLGKNLSKKKNDDFYLEGVLKLDKPERVMGREIYKNGKEDHLYFRDNPKVHKYSLSQFNDYGSLSPNTYKGSVPPYFSAGDAHIPSHVSQPKHGLNHSYDGFCEPNEKLQMSPGFLGHRSDDLRNSSRSYRGLDEEKRVGSSYGRSEIDRLIVKPRHFEEEYKDHHTAEIGIFDSTVDKSYKRKYARDDPPWDPYSSSIQQSDPDKFYPSTSLHERKMDLDILGSGSEAYVGHGNMKSGERHSEVRSGPWSNEERSDVLRSRDTGFSFSKSYDIPQNTGWVSEDMSRVEPYGRRLRHEHVDDDSLSGSSAGMKISCDGYGARKIYNPLDDEMEIAKLSKKPKVGKSGYDKARRTPNKMPYHHQSSGKPISRHSSSPHKPKARSVKSRLGPLPPKLHVSQRLEKKVKKPSIKKRLGPTPSKKHTVLPWVKVSGSSTTPSIQDDSGICPDEDDHMMEQLLRPEPSDKSEEFKQLPRPEPSEKSEEFKQLVQSAFFKFLKQINETPLKRKQYTEQGKAGGLKCIVCGSNSEEFTNTEGLAMHTFTSKKPGLRCQHLGLHKALCVVNGWKTAELPISVWQCEEIPNAENMAIKEDIIIWPPAVIVHNSSIDNKNPDERIIVSTEELVLKFKGMGFANITKVCNGKPANQSVMVVKFNGTLSGLQEAERLHNSYVETKQSEPEFQQLESGTNGSSGEGTPAAAETKQTETELQQLESSTNGSSGEGTPAAAETKQTETELQQLESNTNGSSGKGTPAAAASKEKYLDGHLGLAEDLDKLDFDTKKRCVLRSKIEILRIVGAPLDTNGKKGSC